MIALNHAVATASIRRGPGSIARAARRGRVRTTIAYTVRAHLLERAGRRTRRSGSITPPPIKRAAFPSATTCCEPRGSAINTTQDQHLRTAWGVVLVALSLGSTISVGFDVGNCVSKWRMQFNRARFIDGVDHPPRRS
jgi:hypothetical protein